LAVLCAAAAIGGIGLSGVPAQASSHREAPLISQDPVADNTDLYMFRSPDRPDHVTIVANYIGLEQPAGGPNFARFGDDVLYEIHLDNNGDVREDITYQFRFRTVVANGNTFLTNLGPLAPPDGQNVRQFYSVRRIDSTGAHVIATDVEAGPPNIGPRSTPNYESAYGANKVATVGTAPLDTLIFAGQRKDPFFVDLGSIFDLAGLRPLNTLHVIPLPTAAGVDGLADKNVHTIAIQIPTSQLLSAGANPACLGNASLDDKSCVVGAYASSSRQSVRVLSSNAGVAKNSGRWVQVSRLGFPLVNEALIPLSDKDKWNATDPADDAQFFGSPSHAGIVYPELSNVLPIVYPGLAGTVPANPRGDVVSLLTGTVQGLSAANQLPPADLLRLNVSTPPGGTSRLGVLGGDAAGFPNGRRLNDDIVDIELQVLAGRLVNGPNIPSGPLAGTPYTAISDGVDAPSAPLPTNAFPYVGPPVNGYNQNDGCSPCSPTTP
jgi:hypothetical protein